MAHFSKLRLYGFKSFVDKTELDIGPGLNGIVGPNGCGKSNLVEALRWVMGERSARNMRGGDMEDVIFAGTIKRPARNVAEVSIVIDNHDGQAPAPFQHIAEIEIIRRVERDKGSQYRINGKSVRARDVNLLFADTMTGANSPALVSQGRITEIISAKPQDRRRILEESSGISGLHSRRHEAELRLRAAEQNLLRLDDMLREMRGRLSSLKRQSRQAERYKELNASIRQFDMALTWLDWVETHKKIKSGRDEFAMYNATIQELLQQTKNFLKDIELQERDLPKLRKKGIELRAVLQNFRTSLDHLEQNIQTRLKSLAEARQAKAQLDKDNNFTKTQYDEALGKIESVQITLNSVHQDTETLPEKIATLENLYNNARTDYQILQNERQELQTDVAVAEESHKQIVSNLDECQQRLTHLTLLIEQTQTEKNQRDTEIILIEENPAYQVDLNALRQSMNEAQTNIENLESVCNDTNALLSDLKNQRDELHSELRGINSEKSTLQTLLDSISPDSGIESLLQSLKVSNGYEKAVSTALDHWLSKAGTDDQAPVHWSTENGSNKVLPIPGCVKITDVMSYPASLSVVMSGIGIVDTTADGSKLAPLLSVGQIIVSKDGDIWRWDGLRVNAATYQTQDTTTLILEQRNRITELEKSSMTISGKLANIENKMRMAHEKLVEEKTQLTRGIDTAHKAKQVFFDTERRQTRFQDQIQSLIREQASLSDRIKQLTEEKLLLDEKEKLLQEKLAKTDISTLNVSRIKAEQIDGKLTTLQNDMDNCQSELAAAKSRYVIACSTIETSQNELMHLEKEKERLFNRLEEFTERQDILDRKIADYQIAKGQKNQDDEREILLSRIAAQDKAVRDHEVQHDIAEKTYLDNQNALREAESKIADTREKRAIIQTNIANDEEELKKTNTYIVEQFGINPQDLEEQILSLFNKNIPDHRQLQSDRDRAVQQRDAIGPVNLRAKIEFDETESQLTELENEYSDLVKAIEQLRVGINKLNREARERLDIAFKHVNQSFQTLFSELFGGGKAYLEMMESRDPLESGLEIYAQPPGKSLQALSLLSGGEQTLTATALIFAMFQTNPSPICVLDEIDAPLDDANVDRVCSLMERIAHETDTRFIVITHHRMTMARMNRLYGVTMGERGVSQLVSVDLGTVQEELQLAETA